MAAQEKPIPADALPELRALATQMRAAKASVGISYKELAARTHYSTASLCQAASGKKLPTWEVAWAYARGCEGQHREDFWDQLWAAARDADHSRNTAESPADAATTPPGTAARRRKSVADLVREEVQRQQNTSSSSQASLDATRTALALCITPDEFRTLLKELKGTRPLSEIKCRARSKGYTLRMFNIRTMIGDGGDEIPDTEPLHAYLVGCGVEAGSIQDWHHAATRLKISQALRCEPVTDTAGLFRRLLLWLRRLRSELRLEALIGLICTVLVTAVQIVSMLKYY